MKPSRKKNPAPKNDPASFSPSDPYPKVTQHAPKEKLIMITMLLIFLFVPLFLSVFSPIPCDEANNSLGALDVILFTESRITIKANIKIPSMPEINELDLASKTN